VALRRPRPRRDTDTEGVLRNSRRTRLFHTWVYVVTAFLLLSGIAVLGEGRPAIERILGGHVSTAHWHRWIGFVLIGSAALVLLLRPRAVGRFLIDSVIFGRDDLRWFVTYPGFLTASRRHAPGRHRGHFDPGQRVMNVTIVVCFAALSVTGLMMAFPQRITPAAFEWSVRVHRLATWLLAGAVAGHVVVASGVLPAYRGVWRAMHRGGRVQARLAHRLWPVWTERQPEAAREGTGDQSEGGEARVDG
jgi:cytochrome b subunit of formate dehydrogenase